VTAGASQTAVAEWWREEIKTASFSPHQRALFAILIEAFHRQSVRLGAVEAIIRRKGLTNEERETLKAAGAEVVDPEGQFQHLVAFLLPAAEK